MLLPRDVHSRTIEVDKMTRQKMTLQHDYSIWLAYHYLRNGYQFLGIVSRVRPTTRCKADVCLSKDDDLVLKFLFFTSNIRKHWLLHRSTILQAKCEDLQYITDRELVKLGLHYANCKHGRGHLVLWEKKQESSSFCHIVLDLHKLGKKMNVRQQVVATASVYFKRFFIKYERHAAATI